MEPFYRMCDRCSGWVGPHPHRCLNGQRYVAPVATVECEHTQIEVKWTCKACGKAFAPTLLRADCQKKTDNYPMHRMSVSLGPVDPTDPIVAKMIENGDIEIGGGE